MSFSCGDEAGVERFQWRVPMEGGRQGSGIQGASQPGTTAADMSLAIVCASLPHERRQPGQRRCLFAVQLAEFRHPHQQRQGGAFANAWYARPSGGAGHTVQPETAMTVKEMALPWRHGGAFHSDGVIITWREPA